MVEEGIKGLFPSSFEISFPAKQDNKCNTTHANIERHAETQPNSVRNTIQNNKQRLESKQKGRAFS